MSPLRLSEVFLAAADHHNGVAEICPISSSSVRRFSSALDAQSEALDNDLKVATNLVQHNQPQQSLQTPEALSVQGTPPPPQQLRGPQILTQSEPQKLPRDEGQPVLEDLRGEPGAGGQVREPGMTQLETLQIEIPSLRRVPAERSPTLDDLIAALKGEDKDGVVEISDVETLKFHPSVETIVRETGPDHLGRNVDGLSWALNRLMRHTHTYLTPDRIAGMTSEEVPELLTPVASSLNDVLRSAGVVKNRLSKIEQASQLLLGRAEARGEARLGLPEEPIPPSHPGALETEGSLIPTSIRAQTMPFVMLPKIDLNALSRRSPSWRAKMADFL